MRKRFLLAVMAFALCAWALPQSSGPGTALPPPSTGGIAAIEPALRKLSTNKRLLVIGAHPDDENTALLALVARGMGGEAAYLSLSRGEGGQNLIGQELGVGLGLIRSRELGAARLLDGARQYFTRAYDFGFSKSLDETLRFWPKQEILKDTVRVIRRFRPQVVFATFTGTPRDGHGQHQESAVVAREAFHLAADPSAFPELADEGLAPWRATTLVRSNWFDDKNAIRLATGDVDPLSGRSYNQIAMASRSLHRSQEMGRLQPAGPSDTGAIWEEGGQGPETKDLFGGVDTRLAGIADAVTDPARRAGIADHLASAERLVETARTRLAPDRLSAIEPDLASALSDLRAAREALHADAADEAAAAAILGEKEAAAETALAAVAGVTLDALADRETASAGETFSITVQLWNAGTEAVDVQSIALESPDGWTLPPGDPGQRTVAPGTLAEWKLSATVPAHAAPTIPYFLAKPLQGDLYDWSAAPPSVRGEPFQPPPLSAAVGVKLGGTNLVLHREATYRFRNEEYGEIRHSLRAVPLVEVSVGTDLLVWPTEQKDHRTLEITVKSNSAGSISGKVVAQLPAGWPAAAPGPFILPKSGEKKTLEIAIAPASPPQVGRFEIPIAAVLDDGQRFDSSVALIDYQHIRPTPMPKGSTVALTSVDLRLPRLKSVGYVRGASDRVPEALAAVGVPIHLLSSHDLEHADLSHYDAIVIGSRAYETEPALPEENARILEYARAGGLVIVQYQQYPYVEGHQAPDALEIARPHDRVTDETAPVKILDPSHPLFTRPNKIGPADWDGWVQERGLYFAHSWGPSFTPLLAMNDPGQSEQRGGLLVSSVGKGHYVYTGLAFFRELPAGVPGAYRLFANLLAWR